MDTYFINATYQGGEVFLSQETFTYLKPFKVIALYAAIQFVPYASSVAKTLEQAGHTVITSQPARTFVPYQILGCDLSFKNLNLSQEPDAFLYLGDGKFHPQALVLSQKTSTCFKPVIRYDPIQHHHIVMTLDEIKSILKKYKGSLMKFLASDRIGVLISVKPGQQHFKPSLGLEEMYPDKTFYYFVENTIDFSKLEDFLFIQAWVNTACPRIGFDDNVHLTPSMVNLMDAFAAKELLSQENFLTTL